MSANVSQSGSANLKIFRVSNKHGDEAFAIVSNEDECRNVGLQKGFVRKKENLSVFELSDNLLAVLIETGPALLERNVLELRAEGSRGLFRVNPGRTELFQMF